MGTHKLVLCDRNGHRTLTWDCLIIDDKVTIAYKDLTDALERVRGSQCTFLFIEGVEFQPTERPYELFYGVAKELS